MAANSSKPYSDIKIKPNPIVDLPQGKVEGFVLQSRESCDYFGFYGIPFAKQPQRFQPPEKWEKWTGTLDATKARERCTQASLIMRRVFGSEDCLFLNIFTKQLPSPQSQDTRSKQHSSHKHHKDHRRLLPVMVFIHGGGYYVGGGDLFGGKYLVDHGVILVTFNYRLGALGFLNSGDGLVKGNMGLLDQVMCLKWIQENIIYFGGDKNQVTLFGESAGAACVHFHLMSPMSKGLFHRAVMQSGNGLSPWALTKNPAEKVRDLVKQLGIDCDLTDMPQMVEVLTELNPFMIAAQRMDFTEWKEQPLVHFAPSVESGIHTKDSFLTETPLSIIKSNKFATQVPLMMGVNAEEGAYRAIPLLQDPQRLQKVNDNWVEEAHQFLLYNKATFPDHSDFASSVRKFYFGDKPIGKETRRRLVDMLSDRMFIHSTKTTALYHANFHRKENPIYLYIFDYEGEFSYLNSFGIFETYGATHADELQYILNQRIFYSKIMRGTADDYMIGKMSEIWSNFAKSGVPKYSLQDVVWEPLEFLEGTESTEPEAAGVHPHPRPLQYYQISQTDSIIDEPFKSRMAFWESLPYHVF